jgi:hypothetical protein
MADYHPLILRAVAGLENNTGENRRVLYERARAALVNQLRGVDPPLQESDITRERLALEEAIRKVEADAAMQAQPPEPAEAPQPSLTDQGLRGFRETVAEADNLGAAAAQASHSAREIYEAVPGEGQLSDSGSGNGGHYFEPPGGQPPPHDGREPMDEAPSMPPPRPRPYQMPEGTLPPPPFEPQDDYVRPVRNWGGIVKWVVLVLVISGLAGAGYWQRKPILTMLAHLHSTTVPKPQQAAAPANQPKINDRIAENNGPSKTATAPAAAVAQKVVLYNEEPGNPKGKRYVGSAIWRTETVSPGSGLAPELAVRADVEIPELHMRMTWSLRRNTDKALPASHTIEIQFTLPADFAEGGIGNVPGVLMKTGEEARGIPLAGLSVKVTDGYFLIGLSAVDVDKQRNIEMLKNRDWMDIPIVYTSGKRGIMAIEKGPPGQRAFDEAFRAWGE